MAFPTIPTVAAGRVLSVLALSPSGTHTSPNLSSLTKNSGDLLIAIVIIYDGNSTNAEFSAWGGGFTEFSDNAGTATMGIGCAYKWSTGSETGTFTVTTADASTNDSAFFLLSIPEAHVSTPPEAGSFVTGTGAAADPGSFDPAGWGAEDTLWIAVGGSGEDGAGGAYTGIASAPTNYGNYADSGISADVVGGVEGAVAFRQLNATSVDVGTYSLDLTNARNSALVIAVRPRPTTDATAEAATGTGTAFLAAITLSIAAALSSGAGTAYNATIQTGTDVAAGAASGTGTAYTPAAGVAGSSGTATGTGSGAAPAPSVGARPSAAPGSGAAYDATVSTGGAATNANAGLASGTGTAYNATVSTSAVVGWHPWSDTYSNPVPSVSHSGPPLGAALVSREAGRVPPRVRVPAGIARGYGRAYDATVEWNDDETALLLLLLE